MQSHPIVFITLKEYDNLGVGYMASLLSANGFVTRVVDIRKNKVFITKYLKRLNPLLVGFSVIYQNYLSDFTDLISHLRNEEVNCHFTAGGHYASLKFKELYKYIPYLDSIVMFEGEYTILDLASRIQNGKEWRNTEGIAYLEKGKIIENPLRSFEIDLDKFPFPLRSPLRTYAFGLKFTTIIAGRGCTYNCTFCNTKKFYSRVPGNGKRIRRPDMVVKEMKMLFHKRNCSVFLFLDDDFPVRSASDPDWIKMFCNELESNGLSGNILWKICCRPDEVNEETFKLMKRHGLFLTFLGIEDGTDTGLKRLNKNMTTESSINAVNILKKLDIGIDYGFMLFQPYSTFSSLNENLDFLRKICYDGYTPVTFLKMMPYYETAIEKDLIKSGRLVVSNGVRDYDFLNDSMNHYFKFITDCFTEWLSNSDGLGNNAIWALNYCSVYLNYFDTTPEGMKFYRKVKRIVSESNLFILDTMKELSHIFESDQYKRDRKLLESFKEMIKSKHDHFRNEIVLTIANMLSCVQHQQITSFVQKYDRWSKNLLKV